MKTLVVLSALVAAAIAAPALHEDGFASSPLHLPGTFKRERKSTLEPKDLQTQSTGTTTLGATPQGLTGRSLILKKPIIVKKKEGYHVYRDSDEEQADSRETCVQQVKVKLCDNHSIKEDMSKSAHEDPNLLMSEDEMKHSIKMAKEAVENIQRDLQKAERTPGDMTLKHDNSESDVALHHDIEKARQALEHIHQNFGNLEAMSLHSSVKDAETKDHNQFTIAKTEEERLAQWKEALENINRNVEIARNIEDSFKLDGEQSEMFSEDAEVADAKMRNAESSNDTEKDMKHEDDSKMTPKEVKMSELEDMNTQLLEDDMNTSPSIALETKALADDNDNIELFKNAAPKDENTKILLEKHAEMEMGASNLTPKTENMEIANVMEGKDTKLESESLKKHEDSSEAKSAEHENLKDIKKSLKSTSVKHIENKEKSAEQEIKHALTNEHEKEAVDTTMLVKSAEEDKEKAMAHTDMNVHETMAKEDEPKMEGKMNEEENLMSHSLSHEDLKLHQQLRDSNPDNKAIEDIESSSEHHHHEGTPEHHHDGTHHHEGDQQQHENHHHKEQHRKMPDFGRATNIEQSQTRWVHDGQMPMASMKAADVMQNEAVDTLKSHQFAGHHHHMEHLAHQPGNAHIHSHPHHGRFHENFMPQGKSADMEAMQPTYYMRENTGAENNRFRWMPAHETARSAYGAPAPVSSAASSSGGAVGLFPNANVGGCGIPLLLSCNPSVVSGSLAKPQHSYAAPSYRSEDEFNFLAKRDIKSKDKLNRTPTFTKTKVTTLTMKQ